MLSIVHLTSQGMLEPYLSGIQRLLFRYQHVLRDDFTTLEALLENTIATIPYLWIVVSEPGQVYAVSALTQVIPGRYAFLHGISDPSMRRHPAIQKMASQIFETAFQTLKISKLKAEFDSDNMGAKGFCWRFGFEREACLKADTQKQGQKQDVLLYALLKERYLLNRGEL